jgi:hypothetical protein
MVSLRQKTRLTKQFFTVEFFETYRKEILNLKVRDFFNINRVAIRYEQFCHNTQIPMMRDNFNTLKNTCSMAKLKYSKKDGSKTKCTELTDFIYRKKRGCKRYRKLIIGDIESYIPHNMIKFAETTDTVIDLETSKKLNALWANTALGNSTRTFLFKLHNNTAGYNLSVSHFVRGHSPNCTFCDVLEIPEEHNETPLHLFYQCTAVENLTNEIFSWLLNSQVEISRHELFTVFNRDDFRKNDFLTIFSKLLLKYYWDCKQRFCIPTLQNAKTILRGELEVLVQCNAKIRSIHVNSGINFNRE